MQGHSQTQSSYFFLNLKKREIIKCFKRSPLFFLAGMEVRLDQGGGRILVGDNTSDAAADHVPVCCWN